ncbi:hypothetical protein CVT25_005042, partial [Psilocybe cyanescens]
AWKAKCLELLQSTARFQGSLLSPLLPAPYLKTHFNPSIHPVHDFFTPQPIHNAAVFLLRVVLHNWPNVFARKILLLLREAAMPETKLVIVDFVLSLACSDDDMGGEGGDGVLDDIEGARTSPAPALLLANLRKASANVYWMDLTMQTMFNSQERTLRELVSLALSAGWKIVKMQTMFNSQERTLRELVSLALSAGWKVVKVTRTSGSMFGYLVAEPVDIHAQYQDVGQKNLTGLNQEGNLFSPFNVEEKEAVVEEYAGIEDEKRFERQRRYKARERERDRGDMEMIERASSPCGTLTFGLNTRLSSVEEALARLGGGIMCAKAMSRAMSTPSSNSKLLAVPALKPALSLLSMVKMTKIKKKPSPHLVPPLHSSPSPVGSPLRLKMGVPLVSTSGASSSSSTQTTPPQRQSQSQSQSPDPQLITRRMSLASLRSTHSMQSVGTQPQVSSPQRQLLPLPLSPSYTQTQTTLDMLKMHQRASYAHMSQMQMTAHANLPACLSTGSVSPNLIPAMSMIPIRVNGELLPPASPSNNNSTYQRHLHLTLSTSTSSASSVLSSVAGSPRPRTPRVPVLGMPPHRASNAHLQTVGGTTSTMQPVSAVYRKHSGMVVVGPSISLREGDTMLLRTGSGEGGRA